MLILINESLKHCQRLIDSLLGAKLENISLWYDLVNFLFPEFLI